MKIIAANLKTQIKDIWKGFKKRFTEKPLYLLLLLLLIVVGVPLAIVTKRPLWDWLELLIVPLALAIVGIVFTITQKNTELKIAENARKTDRKIALERQRQNTLEKYFDRMKELLLDRGLAGQEADKTVKRLARTLTINVLSELGEERNRLVTQFLQETELLTAKEGEKPTIHFRKADLRKVNLRGAVLYKADLRHAYLGEADLSHADLRWANLYEARLHKADLSKANLYEAALNIARLDGADLREANLRGADMSGAYLSGADMSGAYLSGATLRGGASLAGADLRGATLHGADLSKAYLSGAQYDSSTKWPDDFDPGAAYAINVDEEVP